MTTLATGSRKEETEEEEGNISPQCNIRSLSASERALFWLKSTLRETLCLYRARRPALKKRFDGRGRRFPLH